MLRFRRHASACSMMAGGESFTICRALSWAAASPAQGTSALKALALSLCFSMVRTKYCIGALTILRLNPSAKIHPFAAGCNGQFLRKRLRRIPPIPKNAFRAQPQSHSDCYLRRQLAASANCPRNVLPILPKRERTKRIDTPCGDKSTAGLKITTSGNRVRRRRRCRHGHHRRRVRHRRIHHDRHRRRHRPEASDELH